MVTCYISNVGPPGLSQPSPPAVLVTMSSTDIIELKMFRLEKVFLNWYQNPIYPLNTEKKSDETK